jgi:hypothetical protein
VPFSLPPIVSEFIAAHLRTVDDLHLLVATANEADRWWDAGAVARELLIDDDAARGLLEHLAAHNLLDIRVTGDVRYQFRPGTPELTQSAAACMYAYRSNPAAVWRALGGQRGARAIRDFADAFRIRRDR